MPYYFRGTNCRASGVIVPFQTDPPIYTYVQHAELSINGLVVATYDQPAGEPIPMSVSLSAMFDSTHFLHLQSIEVKMAYWDNEGNYFDETGTSYVDNGVVLAQYPDASIGNPAGIVGGVLPIANFSHFPLYGSWGPDDFVNGLSAGDVVFYSGHGSQDLIQAGKWWDPEHDTLVVPFGDDRYYLDHPAWLWQSGVEPHRVAQMGSFGNPDGYPPYNSTHVPDIYLAYLDACETGASNNFIRFCYPYWSAYGYWLEDQAMVGFVPIVFSDEAEKRAQVMFDSLGAGWTLRDSRSDVVLAGFTAEDASGIRALNVSDLAIYGDESLRLRSVYTGDFTPPIGWFRSIGS